MALPGSITPRLTIVKNILEVKSDVRESEASNADISIFSIVWKHGFKSQEIDSAVPDTAQEYFRYDFNMDENQVKVDVKIHKSLEGLTDYDSDGPVEVSYFFQIIYI